MGLAPLGPGPIESYFDPYRVMDARTAAPANKRPYFKLLLRLSRPEQDHVTDPTPEHSPQFLRNGTAEKPLPIDVSYLPACQE